MCKIIWPEEWTNAENSSPQFLYSVDGVHCRTNEIMHPTLAKNTKLYSHKFNQAGFDYELALSLTGNSLVWMNGPFLGSKHDVTVFRDDGLKDNTPWERKELRTKDTEARRVFFALPTPMIPQNYEPSEWEAQRPYIGVQIVAAVLLLIPLKYPHLQSRARARHETFDSRIKNFACLDQRFRHGMEKHKICFEAVCVIVQYQLENAALLF